MKGVVFLGLLTLFSHTAVNAAILNPYVVDEKPRVLFGDSTPVLSYFGLENYTQDYVNGYAHLTFTYTHHDCCFASYPPVLYITDADPRITTTPVVRFSNILFHLQDRFHNHTHSTDWYLYDVQFDATGYNLSVKKAGTVEIANERREIEDIKKTDWIALANHHPFFITDSMAFKPVLVTDPALLVNSLDPVIIIPGIMGSAYKNGQLVIDPILHTYDDLIATLIGNGYVEGENLFTFPYEWRNSNVFTANLLDDKISEVKLGCECDKVDIVAHSMGGLVSRTYIQSVDYDQDVDQLIFLGTPHKGSPKDYLTWEAGKFPVTLLDAFIESFFLAEARKNGYSTVFDYIRMKPILSVQELLPIYDYIKEDGLSHLRVYPNNYPRNIFLENLENNISSLLNSGVKISNIVGNSGENKTIESIRVIPTNHAVFWEHGEPDGFGAIIGDNGLERGVGDNTVPAQSSFMQAIVNEPIAASHNRLPAIAANKVVKILTNKDSVTNIDNGVNLDIKVLLFQLLSPIDVVITGPDGKRVGKNFETGEEYNEIPLAFYSGHQTDNEYLTILNPLDGEYKVEIQGTDNGGEYGVLTSYISDEGSVTKEISGLTEPNQITFLDVEIDNTNPESLESKRVITSEVLLNDINKASELGWITDQKLKERLIKKVEAIVRVEVKIDKLIDKDKNREMGVERLDMRIDKMAAKALLIELRGYERGKINEQAYNIIKEDLEWLIEN